MERMGAWTSPFLRDGDGQCPAHLASLQYISGRSGFSSGTKNFRGLKKCLISHYWLRAIFERNHFLTGVTASASTKAHFSQTQPQLLFRFDKCKKQHPDTDDQKSVPKRDGNC